MRNLQSLNHGDGEQFIFFLLFLNCVLNDSHCNRAFFKKNFRFYKQWVNHIIQAVSAAVSVMNA